MSERPRKLQHELEQRLGYSFADPALLDLALTHPSAITSSSPERQLESYQRLEFLGDRVLGLVVADMLYAAYRAADEGDLHRRHASLVRKETCADVGAELGIGDALTLGESEESSGGRQKLTILGDACEAVIGAIYLDGGLDAARALIERSWSGRMSGSHRPARDAKSTLQEWTQGQGLPVPRYRVVEASGPAHAPRFVISVDLERFPSATGEGPSKREAEQAAATAILLRENVWKANAR